MPIPLETTVGRQRDLVRVAERLALSRVCCVTGPVGVGKSHLAQRAAASLAADFPGGVHYCEVGSVADEPTVAALIEALHVPLGPALLVVDGADACAPALRALLPGWLGEHPRRRVLVTSRERPGIAGEVAIPLEPLSVAEAVTLFVERARALDDRFVPTDAERRAIEEIVRRVDALPLAVRLCAAQTLVLRPTALLAHLRTADARLEAGSMRPVLDAAFRLLPEDTRRLLVSCAVFDDTFTFEAAVAVAGATLAGLMVLCERSFVRPSDDPTGGRRFRLYRPVRDFALAGEAGLDAALRERHRAFYLGRVDRADDAPDADETRRNLLAAAEHDVEAGAHPRALETLVAVTPLVLRLGPTGRALALFERAWPAAPPPEALHAAGALCLMVGALQRAVERFDLALATLPPAASRVAEVLCDRATAARLLGRAEAATGFYDRALAHPAVTAPVAARTLERLAGHLFEQGRHADARARLDAARAAYASLPDAAGLARVQHALGLLEQEDGDVAAAVALFRDAQLRHTALGDERFAAIARFDEGAALLEDDAPAAAREVLDGAVERLEAFGDRRQAALGRALLGVCAARLDDLVRARGELSQALAEVEAMGDAAMIAAIRVHHGHVEPSPAQAASRVPAETSSDEERYAVRVLTRALRATAETLRIAPDGAFIERPDGARVEIKAASARRILAALLEARARGAGIALEAEALFRSGWPGERVLGDAARNRLQVALSMLRKAGLGARLVRTGDAYRLTGEVRVKGG